MKIKRYFAPDVRQAMRMVRDAQGPDAVILSNKSVDGGVEVVAAIDYDESIFRRTPPAASQPQQNRLQAKTSQPSSRSTTSAQLPLASDRAMHTSAASRYKGGFTASTSVDEQPNRKPAQPPLSNVQWGQEPAIVEMQSELKSLRGMLEKQLSGLAWDNYSRRNPRKAELIQHLTALGLNDELSKVLADEVPERSHPDDLFSNALDSFSGMLPVADDEILNEGGVIALVGPTGVGKTTTAAKLAARYALRHGSRHVALVTIDNYRVSAHEQLRTYGRILDIPVKTADSRQELRKVLDDLCDRRLVLIDTAGMSQRDSHLAEQASILCGDDMYIKSSLVISTTSQRLSIQEVIRAFSVFSPVSMILTKLDEATSLGGALEMAMQYHIPISYVCDGQQVPEDLHLARAPDLVNRCVDIMERTVPAEGEGNLDLIIRSNARGVSNANV